MTNTKHQKASHPPELGDFSLTPRVVGIAGLAIGIGLISSVVAVALLRLIALFTNLFYYQRWSFAAVSPSDNTLGYWAILVPVAGALIIGLMARYGSERIRGHGIPEALESILINGSKVQPRLAILKPISSAISIGSGGPFGAEGPIIMTGGAFGSMIAQLFHLTSNERKTLLVAGAAAGMSATFAAPLSAVLLAVELLLFEWKPRSFIPVALASATAGAARRYFMGLGPLFPVPAHPLFIGPWGLVGCAVSGLLAGLLATGLTGFVYAAEDAFLKLKFHWMWWPAIGGVVIGLGGLLFPQALGVGYETIGQLIQGDVPLKTVAGVLLIKSTIWAVALGSGTSGGVLAPLLMMGAALGGLEGSFLPTLGAGFWALVSMSAILGGTMRSPFTGVVFALELTHDFNMLLPLLVATTLSYTISVLFMKRSILTEKIARRGYHLSREYSIDCLEILFVREVMKTKVTALEVSSQIDEVISHGSRSQRLYPVIDAQKRLVGAVTRTGMEAASGRSKRVSEIAEPDPVVAYANEPLRVVAYRMAESGFTQMPVLDSPESRKLVGMLFLKDLLRARVRSLSEERDRERVLHLRLPFRPKLTSGEPASH
jgi:H+/Cl- antiporter ClcA/predicted transcriptional regulator